MLRLAKPALAALGLIVLTPAAALAQAGAPPARLDSGDTAWVLAATALVLFMTLPGLALFYAGLVRQKNTLSVMIHCVAIACLASVLWLALGYTLSFDGAGALIGGLGKAFLLHTPRSALHGTIPESAFFTFQLTFAVITPGLIVGAYVERIRFTAVLLFSALWLLLVYAPVTHWVWGGGWLAQRGVMDYAGGLVVHATAGISALVLAVFLGRRDGFPRNLSPPHNPGMTMIGAGMLWVGWYGFNGGSALAAGGDAAMAILVTHISASSAGLVWALLERWRFQRPSMVGMVTGAVAGLATITPASGYVGPLGGLILGTVGSVVCFFAVDIVKHRFRIDDALDVFAVHGVGGILGTLLVAFLAAPQLGGVGYGRGGDMASQALTQVIGVAVVCLWSGVASIALALLTRAVTGLRARDEEIEEGLDMTYHGERAYNP
ncbi:ammonium transporter [Caulobacter sp. KR2-114]|uniref:ammonium transporter n=1 Tax=Caulobacter sp. KR2-114 TaxID=3400912 RepID=UPI003C109DA4